jgi:D-hexose-6-phosphate mutarotase
MALNMRNTGTTPLRFSEALHTYLRVGDVHRVALRGLEGAEYLDKTMGFKRCRQGDQPVTFTGETDRVYLHTQATCALEDPALGRRIVIEKSGSDATVVWNPWQQRAAAMADFDDDGWRTMVCVETANAAEHAITLEPGAEHEMTATLRVEPLA